MKKWCFYARKLWRCLCKVNYVDGGFGGGGLTEKQTCTDNGTGSGSGWGNPGQVLSCGASIGQLRK